MSKIYGDPSSVTPFVEGVAVKGPDHVSVTMTPEAAAETANRLLDAAAASEGDRLMAEELAERRRRDQDNTPS